MVAAQRLYLELAMVCCTMVLHRICHGLLHQKWGSDSDSRRDPYDRWIDSSDS